MDFNPFFSKLAEQFNMPQPADRSGINAIPSSKPNRPSMTPNQIQNAPLNNQVNPDGVV